MKLLSSQQAAELHKPEQKQSLERLSSQDIKETNANVHFTSWTIAECLNDKSGKLIILRCQDGWQAFPP
jgi:hypothetical protein